MVTKTINLFYFFTFHTKLEIDVNSEGVQIRRNMFLIVEIEKYFSNRLIKSVGPARMTGSDIINMSEICQEVEFRPSARLVSGSMK